MSAKKRPDVLKGKTYKVRTDCGSFYLTVNELDGELFEIKMELGKSGNCIKNMLHLIGILYSILVQMGVDKKILIKTIKRHCLGVSCGSPFMDKGKTYKSCLDWAGQMILKELKAHDEVSKQ